MKATDKQLETLRTSSKYKYEEIMKKNEFGIIEEVLTKANIQKEQRPYVREFCKNLTEVRKYYKGIVQSAISLRKQIFTGMSKFNKITQGLIDHIGKSTMKY